MSHIDPEVYKYEALKPEDKRFIDFYDIAAEDAVNREFIMDDMMGLMVEGGETIIGKMKREIANEVFDAIEEYLDIQRTELIASIMDGDSSYEEEP